jgi:integrase/recombinase XerC
MALPERMFERMLIDKFLRYLKYEKRCSAHTLNSYGNDLEQFATYLKRQYDEKDLRAANHFYIRSWMVHLLESGIKSASINRKISTLRSFYRFLVREGILSVNPMKKIITPKIPSRLPHFIHTEKMETVFSDRHFDDSFEGRQERIILELLYATGMRRAELAGLKESDIDFANHIIRVYGKRNKERLIPMLPSLAKALQQFIQEKSLLRHSEFLLTDPTGRPLGAARIYQIVKKHLTLAGVPGKKSPHVLRHTFATHLLNNGADINALKEILGHASLAATQIYTHNTIEKLKSVYKQAHPKA